MTPKIVDYWAAPFAAKNKYNLCVLTDSNVTGGRKINVRRLEHFLSFLTICAMFAAAERDPSWRKVKVVSSLQPESPVWRELEWCRPISILRHPPRQGYLQGISELLQAQNCIFWLKKIRARGNDVDIRSTAVLACFEGNSCLVMFNILFLS